MKITKSGHKNVRLLNEKMVKEQLMKKGYIYMTSFGKQQKNLQIKLSSFE